MTKQELDTLVSKGELVRLHTSYTRGYISRKKGPIVFSYNGRFGEGFVVLSPNWQSTRYSYITYYKRAS